MEIANAVEAVQDGRIFIELINDPFLYEHKGSPAEYGAGLKLAIERGWLGSTRAALCEAHTIRRGSVGIVDHLNCRIISGTNGNLARRFMLPIPTSGSHFAAAASSHQARGSPSRVPQPNGKKRQV